MISPVQAAIALFLTLASADIALAIDWVRTEARVDKAVASLGVSGEGVIVATSTGASHREPRSSP